jgi:hypothetical protein
MGLPEYQAMPSLRDAAHDGRLCTFTVQYITAAGNSSARCWAASVRACRYSTVHLPGHPPLASQAGRHVGSAL